MSKAPGQDASDVLKGVIQVLERRVNAYGVAEPVIQSQGTDRVIVELPGVKDIEEAKKNWTKKITNLKYRAAQKAYTLSGTR